MPSIKDTLKIIGRVIADKTDIPYVLGHQSNAANKEAHVVVTLLNAKQHGLEETRYVVDPNDSQALVETVTRNTVLSISCNFYQDEYAELANKAKLSFQLSSAALTLRVGEVAFRGISDVINLTAPLGGGFEHRSNFTIKVNILTTAQDVMETIGIANIVGDFIATDGNKFTTTVQVSEDA